MSKNFMDYMNTGIVFLLVFSIFNDKLLVDYTGESILKIIFLLFIAFNAKESLENFKRMHLLQDKLFFLFIIAMIVVFLIQIIIDMPYDLMKPIFALLAMSLIVIYYSRYPLKKLLYMLWISMMISIIVCYFVDPLTSFSFRKSGGTHDMNTFAAEVLGFFFISIYLYNINKSKIFILISGVGTVYALFSAGSKTSFVVFGLILVFIMMRYLFFRFNYVFNYKFLVIFLILVIGAVQIDFTQFNAVQNMLGRAKKTHTLEVREEAWSAGFKMVEDNPILGVGFMQFVINTPRYIGFRIAPHNTYIKLISEMGIPVFVFFIMFLYVLLIQYFGTYILSEYFWLYLSVISIFLMGVSLGLTFHKAQWFFIALMMNVNYLVIKRKQE